MPKLLKALRTGELTHSVSSANLPPQLEISRLPLLDTVRLLYPVNVRLNRGLVYGAVWIGKLATEMIGQYIVLDEVLEPYEQRRLCAGHIFQLASSSANARWQYARLPSAREDIWRQLSLRRRQRHRLALPVVAF
jgi:hypothetical protein